ncbi:MAG: hypothetical protein KKA64_01770 [Nanoarchaeota archaeon]|nr:hypothetical protein [Nanoarchaeota archaeon]
MSKETKLKTPEWILGGFDSEAEYNKSKGIGEKKKEKGKTFKIRVCPECNSDEVNVVLGEEEGKSRGEWECRKCDWVGKEIKEEELSEDEFMKYLDEQDKKMENAGGKK